MRARSLKVLILFLSILISGFLPVAAPGIAQDTGTPPLIEPSDGPDQGNGAVLETNFELGNGGQPEDFPREIAVDGARFLFDRMVPASRQELVPVASEGEIQAFAVSDTAPFDAIYLSVPPRNEDELGRYLPEQIGAEQISCLSEGANYGEFDVNGAVYVFAGIEIFLTPDDLEQVATDNNNQPVYADPGSGQPFPELFFVDANGLARFELAGASGAPEPIAESLAIDGAQYGFAADVTGQLDPGTLTKIGCAGPYPVYADADPGSGNRYAAVGQRLFEYTGEGQAPAPTDQPATEEPTEVPTEVPTEQPTEIPTEEPTEVPTEEPTAEPTEVPTEEPTATTEPTEVPTEEPTATTEPTAIPTEEPTVPPTEEPAATEAPADQQTATTEPATQAPASTQAPTPTVPAAQAPVQPTQALQPPAVIPTRAPDAPPPAAVTAEAVTACVGNPGTINAQGLPTYLPNRIQIGGIAYALVGPESPADAGKLTRITCIGAFEVASTDKADRSAVLYLRYLGGGEAGKSVFRFEVATTYDVAFEVTGNAQRIRAGEQDFRLTSIWTMTIHTSGSVNLFVADPEVETPDVYYGVNVSNTVVGDVIGEYRKAEANAEATQDMAAAGERYGLHPDLTVVGQRYVLVNVFLPVGTTTNGFLTLFSATGEGDIELLLGRDKRDLELFIYEPVPQTKGG